MWTNMKRSFPPASILEKMAAHDPAAPAWVMDRAEELQRARPAESAFAWKAFVEGVKDAFRLSARPLPRVQSPEESLRQIWDTVGDYIRMAMRDYMRNNGLSAETLGLTPDEKKALALIAIKNGDYPALDA